MIDKALGGTKQATARLHESNAINDLRVLSSAEATFSAVMGQGRYAAPEQLADATLLKRLGTQPMLEAYFVQPVRQGYQFEFIGEKPDYLHGPLRVFGKVYESFVYVAWPIDPGPEGRRTVALYPDGQVFATSEPRRVPTREDELLGAR